MFGKKERCAICGEKLSFTAIQINGGSICPACNRLSTGSPLASVGQVKHFLFIDPEQKMFYLSNSKKIKLEPVVFKFSEINAFKIEQVGQKTITKTKGGIGRAVVGGALFGTAGAIVGATTAKQETKEVGGVPILYVDLSINGMNTTVSISNPPLKAADYLENAMNE